jgi:hypothetical protein
VDNVRCSAGCMVLLQDGAKRNVRRNTNTHGDLEGVGVVTDVKAMGKLKPKPKLAPAQTTLITSSPASKVNLPSTRNQSILRWTTSQKIPKQHFDIICLSDDDDDNPPRTPAPAVSATASLDGLESIVHGQVESRTDTPSLCLCIVGNAGDDNCGLDSEKSTANLPLGEQREHSSLVVARHNLVLS